MKFNQIFLRPTQTLGEPSSTVSTNRDTALDTTTSEMAFVVLSPSGDCLEGPACCLKQALILSKYATQATCTFLIPNAHLTTMDIPRNIIHQKSSALIRYTIEDQWLDDLDDLAFVLPKGFQDETRRSRSRASERTKQSTSNGHIPVACLKKSLINHWQSQIQAITPIELTGMQPEYLGLPFEEGSWTILVRPHTLLIRMAEYDGFELDRENLPIFLDTLKSNTVTYVPQKIRVFNIGLTVSEASKEKTSEQAMDLKSVTLIINQAFLNLDGIIEISETTIQNDFVWLAKNSRHETEVNFLKRASPLQRHLIRTSVVLLSVAFLFALAIGLTTNLLLNHEKKRAVQQIKISYQKIFPNAQAIVAPRLRVEKKLEEYRQRQWPFKKLSLLNDALCHIKYISLQSFEFKNKKLRFVVVANHSHDFLGFEQVLRQRSEKFEKIILKRHRIEYRI